MCNSKEKLIFVAPNGCDNASGSFENPFLTLQRAKQEVVALKSENSDLEKITVYLREGKYRLDSTFEVAKNEGGSDTLSVVYSSYNNEKAVITGGASIDFNKFTVVEGEKLEYLNDSAKGKVLSQTITDENLAKLLAGTMDWGMQDMNDPNCPIATDISCVNAPIYYPSVCSNGFLLQQARFPKKGYCNMDEILDKGAATRWIKPGESFPEYSLENPVGGIFNIFEKFDIEKWQKEFARTGEIYCDGHFSNDWYTDENYVGKINDDGSIQLLKPVRYGVHQDDDVNRRVMFKNLLCELTQEGEWYFDRKTNELYVMPIKLLEGESYDYEVTGNATTLIHLNDCTNVSLENLSIECASKVGVQMNGGKRNTVAGCTLKNMTEFAVCIDGGFVNGMKSCDVFDCNQAIRVTGGDMPTLTHCNNYVVNNDIHHCKLRGYGVVTATGCGITIRNNLLHEMSCSLSLKTIESVCELNEFYDIGREMGDFNSGYIGVEFYTVGNYFKNNFIHHMMRYKGIKHLGGLRCDDGGLGTNFIGNVFYKAGSYAVASHGPLTTMTDNVVLEVPAVWYTMTVNDQKVQFCWDRCEKYRTGELFAGDKEDLFFRAEQKLGVKGWEKEPFASKYPELRTVLETNPWRQTGNVIARNYTNGDTEDSFEIHGRGGRAGLPEDMYLEDPIAITNDAFENIETLNLKFKDSFKPVEGFATIPFEKIGLFEDEFRKVAPNKDEYRHAVYLKYKDMESSEKIIYERETANEIYSDPTYLNR